MILTANVQHLARIYLTDPLINGKGNLIEKSSVELQEEIILFHVYESLYAGGYVGHSISKPKGQEEGGGKRDDLVWGLSSEKNTECLHRENFNRRDQRDQLCKSDCI